MKRTEAQLYSLKHTPNRMLRPAPIAAATAMLCLMLSGALAAQSAGEPRSFAAQAGSSAPPAAWMAHARGGDRERSRAMDERRGGAHAPGARHHPERRAGGHREGRNARDMRSGPERFRAGSERRGGAHAPGPHGKNERRAGPRDGRPWRDMRSNRGSQMRPGARSDMRPGMPAGRDRPGVRGERRGGFDASGPRGSNERRSGMRPGSRDSAGRSGPR